MRRGNNPEFWFDENEKIIGINLGSDYCAEHEQGIRGLTKLFALNKAENIFGVERRRINKIPKSFELKELKIKNKKHFLLINTYFMSAKTTGSYKNWLPYELTSFNKDLNCAWDQDSFGILVTDKYEKQIKELYQAFLDKDIALGISPAHVFKNGGLSITIISRLPEDTVASIFEKDKDYYDLQVAAKNTGIYDRLDNAGMRYYALSPQWIDKTKKSVYFWLNPYQQQKYRSGWFTVQDLDDWIVGKGKIIIAEK